ncbi:MAG: endonuclease/exonuclease/phosphatase family protein [Candidatus Zixiibacteriota bacterium]|nr:MAG: endonuclease/exonuclease/phosphatase family protein [candidate division Zixibacteria bacterium]
MYHGPISKEIANGLKTLRKRINKAKIPASSLDETINLATWNIREFGRRPREEAAIHYIAEIMNQFDFIAVTELRDNLSDLKRVLKILGPYWKAVFSDYIADPGGNRERVAYVYDKRAVVFTGLAAEADARRVKDRETGEYLPEQSWWRKPFMASFRAGSFDFVGLTAHIRWGSGDAARIAPLELLAKWLSARVNEEHLVDKDFIVMGDFNIPSEDDELFAAITSEGLRIPDALRGITGSNLAQNKRYDQILHYPRFTKCFSNRGGVLDFYADDQEALFPGMELRDFTYQLSDHLPLWIHVNTRPANEQLDQILNQ